MDSKPKFDTVNAPLSELAQRAALEELEGKCHQLWLLNGGETGKWNGMGCDCPWVQGNLICERMKYEIGV